MSVFTSKQGGRDVEEAQEVSEDIVEETQTKRQRHTRNIHNSVFHNNFNMEPVVMNVDATYQDAVVGFTHCLMYLCKY